MKTTIDIPDELFREAKAAAALAGQPLRQLVSDALRRHLRGLSTVPSSTGWRSVFGLADADAVREVDEIVSEEFERVDPGEWR